MAINKKCGMFLLVVSILFYSSISHGAEMQYDFRNTIWGMSITEVKQAENRAPELDNKYYGSKHMLVYSDKLIGLECKVIYIFANDKLVRGKYSIKTKHTNKTDYIQDYDKLFGALENKYGTPTKNDTFWKNNLYKNDPAEWGMAVAVGHMVKFAQWDKERTTIGIGLNGDNFKIDLGVEYLSNELRPLERKVNEDREKDKL